MAVAGSTAPLWTLLLGAGAFVFGASPALAKVIGLAATIAAGILTRRAALALSAAPLVAFAAGLALVATAGLTWGGLSGMEVSLAAALVAGALLAHAHDATFVAVLLASLAVLSRPEAVLFLPVLLIARPLRVRRIVLFVVVPLVVLVPFVAFCLATVGSPLPATVAAKVEGGLLGRLAGLSEPALTTFVVRPRAFLLEWYRLLSLTHLALPLALGVALVAVWWRHGRRWGVPALILLIHPLAMALIAPYRGPGFQEGRYSLHLLPVAMVTLAAALPPAWRRISLVAVAVYLALAVPPLVPGAVRYARAVKNINEMQVHLGRWIDRELPRTARVAANDIGAIAYFSRREIIDVMGLVTPDILRYRRDGDAGVARYLLEQCPDHVVIFPDWFPGVAARSDFLEARYRVKLEDNLVSGADEMVVYRVKRCAV